MKLEQLNEVTKNTIKISGVRITDLHKAKRGMQYRIDDCPNLITLDGIPDTVDDLTIKGPAPKLDSFKGFPSTVGALGISKMNIDNLHDIHKYVKHCRMISLGNNIKHSILGLLLIDGLQYIFCDSGQTLRATRIIADAINNSPNRKGPVSKEVLLDTQDKLIEAGFEEYAKL